VRGQGELAARQSRAEGLGPRRRRLFINAHGDILDCAWRHRFAEPAAMREGRARRNALRSSLIATALRCAVDGAGRGAERVQTPMTDGLATVYWFSGVQLRSAVRYLFSRRWVHGRMFRHADHIIGPSSIAAKAGPPSQSVRSRSSRSAPATRTLRSRVRPHVTR
jgi:hypothetical protein